MMSVSTSSSLQSNVERPRLPSTKGSKEAKDGRFKTSNPQIFPSLHPLSNFYREKTKVAPKQPFPTPKTTSICDPVKKIKVNDNTEKIVVDSNIQINEEKIKDQQLRYDDDGFRVPRLPNRFNMDKKKTVVEEPKQPEAVKIQPEINAEPEPLIIPECVVQDLKPKQSVGFVPRRPVTIVQQAPIRAPMPVKQDLMMISQQEILMRLLMAPLEQASIYDKVDFISSQLRQSVPHLFQICQQNQAKLIQKV